MNTQAFDWSLIRSFRAVMEHGSLLRAARALGASQPTLGRHIEQLENQLGTVLFERTARGLAPTARALALGATAQAMGDAADQLWLRARAAPRSERARVRLSASQPVACGLLPPLLARMHEALGGIQVDLVVTDNVSNLLRREADIALRMLRPTQASLIIKRVGSVTIKACAHRSYLKRCGTPREPQDLLDHELITSDQSGEFERGAPALGLSTAGARFSLRSDDRMAQWAAVRAGMGIGFMSDYLIATANDVRCVLPMLALPTIPVWLTVHREVRTNPHIRAVYNFLADEVPAALAA